MRTSPELLTEILGVLGQINQRLGATAPTTGSTSKTSSAESKVAKGLGLNIGDIAKDPKGSENLKNTAIALKELSNALGPLSFGIIKFGLVPKMFKRSVINFMHDMLQHSKFNGVKSTIAAKQTAESLLIIADALPKLAGGVLKFGIVAKIGLVKATASGLNALIMPLSALGANPFVLAGAAAIGAIGIALQGIAGILSGIAKVILAFAGAIVIMVGAIWLASKLFKVGPLAAMGIIVGSIMILATGLGVIGLMAPAIAMGGIAVAEMGKGLLWLSGALLAFIGSITLMNIMTSGNKSDSESTKNALISIIKPVALLSLLFAGLGLLGSQIKKGSIATQEMGKGMLWMSGGLLALGGVYALLTNVMGVDIVDMSIQTAKTLGLLGLTFAALGLASILIIPGTAVLMAIGLSIGVFSLIALGISYVINKIGGKDGLTTMANNIELLIGGVLTGVIKGVSSALLSGSSSNIFSQIGTVAKNVAILMASIGLITGVSMSLIMFAFVVKAFTQAGIIKTVTGYKANGEPIYGDSVNVTSAGENIAKSIGSFFTTLTKTFENPSIIPDKNRMEAIVDILMGRTGYRVLGIRWAGRPRPGLIDTIAKFAEVISIFSKVNQIPIYDVDKDGNPIIKSFTSPAKIAENIVTTLQAFFGAFKGKEQSFKSISTESAHTMAQVLLGQQAMRIYGLKFGRDQIGILEPIMKFSEVLSQYSKFGNDNRLPIKFDEKGNAIEWVDVNKIGTNIVSGISVFMDSLAKSFTSERVKALNDKSKGLNSALTQFDVFIEKFTKLGSSVEKIDKFGDSVGRLASNIGLLVTNMGELNTENLDKLTTSLTRYADSPAGKTVIPTLATSSNIGSVNGVNMSKETIDLLAQKIGDAVAAKMTGFGNGEFKFTFYDETGKGILQIAQK